MHILLLWQTFPQLLCTSKDSSYAKALNVHADCLDEIYITFKEQGVGL